MTAVFTHRSRVWNLLTLGAAFLWVASAAYAGFTAGLTADEQANCGLSQLSEPELAHLNQLVDRDERFALEGGVVGFDKTFSARLGRNDYAAAGLLHLTPGQRAQLDDLIAFRIAHPAPPVPHFEAKTAPRADPAATRPGSVAASPPSAVVVPGWHPEIHGDASFTLGASKGGSFYGGGIDLRVTDPSGKFTIGAGFYEYRVKGRYFPAFGPYCPPLLEDGEYGPYGLPLNLPRL